jgi:hypothetical protein
VSRKLAFVTTLAVLAAAGGSAAADRTLVGWWRLDEGQGTVAADASGQGNAGAVVGSATWAPGRFGSSLVFDGSSAAVRVPNSPSLEPAAAITVEAWVEHTGSPGDYRYILAKGATGCMAASYGLYTGPDGGAAFYVSSGHGGSYSLSPRVDVRIWDGNWHSLVGTYDGARIRLYLDGSEVGTGTPRAGAIGYQLTDSNDLFIGNYPGCAEHGFVGGIDEPMVMTGALDTAQVRSQYQTVTDGSAGAGPGPPAGPGEGAPGQPGSAGPGSAGPGTTGPVGAGGKPAATGAPRISSLRLTPPVFYSPRSPAFDARTPTGATVSYRDSVAETASFTLLRVTHGHERGGRCRPGRVGGRSCRRYAVFARFVHGDVAGINRFRLARLHGRALPAGSYLLQGRSTAAHVRGAIVSAAFTVLP